MTAEGITPAATMKMWRYMRFSRFVWLLQRKQLWLARADFLGDPWEIALAGNQLQRVLERHPPPTLPLEAEPRESAMERVARIIPQWRRKTFINCWCGSEHESHALWRIYCGPTEGIALESRYGMIESSLHGQRLIKVSYETPGTNEQTPTLEELASKKRPMFEYEHEFRILHIEEDASEAPGHTIDWDPETQLVSIRVHPEADDAFMQAVAATVAAYAPSLKDRVVWSDMRAGPPA